MIRTIRFAAAALAVRAGCDLECGCAYEMLTDAVGQGLIDEAAIDRSLVRLFTARMRLGLFDPAEQVPYANIPFEVNDAPAHRGLAREAARKAIVLLKNEGDLLPLPKDLASIAVIGPNADDLAVLLGNYSGTPSRGGANRPGRRIGETRAGAVAGSTASGARRTGWTFLGCRAPSRGPCRSP